MQTLPAQLHLALYLAAPTLIPTFFSVKFIFISKILNSQSSKSRKWLPLLSPLITLRWRKHALKAKGSSPNERIPHRTTLILMGLLQSILPYFTNCPESVSQSMLAVFSPYSSTWWMSFTQLSTVVLCLFLQTARPLVTKRCFQTVCCLTAIQGLFWVVRPREDVSLMEHGVVSQLCVLVGLKYTLLLKRIIGCLEAKVCPLYR